MDTIFESICPITDEMKYLAAQMDSLDANDIADDMVLGGGDE